MRDADIDAILRGNGSPKRLLLLLSVAAVLVVVAAVLAFLLTRPDGSDVVIQPERAEAVMGRLTTEVELSGSALPERNAELSFEAGGVVTSVVVEEGDEVRAGDALATLDDSDIRRGVETSEVQMQLAQLRLDSLLAGPEESEVASANQAITTARSQVMSAEPMLERLAEPSNAADLASAVQAVASALGQLSSAEQALAALSDPPSTADLASAEQAVANALGQLFSAEQALAALSDPPSTADLASAEQAVANALAQLSGADQALAALSDPPSPSDLSSAEQAVANALAQLSGAEQTLAALNEDPSKAEVAESRSAVTQAEVQFTAADRQAEVSLEALTEAFDGFCERYSGLSASDEVIRQTCVSTLPLSDAQVELLRESFEDRSSTYESFGNSLIDANVARVGSAADRGSAQSALASAQERLTELLLPVAEDDLFQAERSIEAAKASHAAAVAKLEELRAAPG